MYVVLLSGGLASGKDTVASMLSEYGAVIWDLDRIAKEEQERPEALERLQQAFGMDILSEHGRLNRRLLAERAFCSEESVSKLNGICWPLVRTRVRASLDEVAAQPGSEQALIVIEIPLLAEAPDLLGSKDEVITVVAPEKTRLKRAVARGMDEEDARNRLALQASDEQRVALSDTVFTNGGSYDELRAQVDAWYRARKAKGLF